MNTWPGGHRHAMDQDEHERYNATNYPGTRQLCSVCNEPTGRCDEDELLSNDGEPLCAECYEQKKESGCAAVQLLNDAHDLLHNLLCVFVPDTDGASGQTYGLMQRIREHLGDEFDGRGRDVGCPDCNGTGENSTAPKSRSVLRREAAQRGEDAPEFGEGKP